MPALSGFVGTSLSHLILLSRICGADIENTLEHYLILGATAVKSLAQAVASVVVPV